MGLRDLLSIRSLFYGIIRVALRFPLEALFTIAATVCAIVLIELDAGDMVKEGLWLRLLSASYLAMLLSLSVTLFTEYIPRPTLRITGYLVVSVVFFATIYFFQPLLRQTDLFRFTIIVAAAHLLVSFSTYWPAKDPDRFWFFNQALFLRMFTAILYSVVLFLGLAAAISSVRYLFGLDLHPDFYVKLGVVIIGIFQTFFFLSGIPDPGFESDRAPGVGLQRFTGFVLVPLTIVYALILLAYEAKILIEWSLPKGLVSSIILGYSIFGLLSILLTYPIRSSESYPWIRIFNRCFFILMAPILALLFIAIIVRISEYGITEERFIVLSIGVWLSVLTAWFLFKSDQKIVVIPVSLTVVALFITLSPFNLSILSRESQIYHLRSIAAIEDFGDKIKPFGDSLSRAAPHRITSIIDYLINRHGLQAFGEHIAQTIPESLAAPAKGVRAWEHRDQQRTWIYSYLEIDHIPAVVSARHPGSAVIFEAADPEILSVDDYDYVLRFATGQDTVRVNIYGMPFSVWEDKSSGSITFMFKGKRKEILTTQLAGSLNINHAGAPGSGVVRVPRSKLSQQTEVSGVTVEVNWNRATFQDGRMTYGEAFILLKDGL